MANRVSTEVPRAGARVHLSPRAGRGKGQPLAHPARSALRALHAVLDPVVGIDAGRRVHAFGGETHDVDDFRRVLLLVEAIGAIGRLGDALMAVADGELDV